MGSSALSQPGVSDLGKPRLMIANAIENAHVSVHPTEGQSRSTARREASHNSALDANCLMPSFDRSTERRHAPSCPSTSDVDTNNAKLPRYPLRHLPLPLVENCTGSPHFRPPPHCSSACDRCTIVIETVRVLGEPIFPSPTLAQRRPGKNSVEKRICYRHGIMTSERKGVGEFSSPLHVSIVEAARQSNFYRDGKMLRFFHFLYPRIVWIASRVGREGLLGALHA